MSAGGSHWWPAKPHFAGTSAAGCTACRQFIQGARSTAPPPPTAEEGELPVLVAAVEGELNALAPYWLGERCRLPVTEAHRSRGRVPTATATMPGPIRVSAQVSAMAAASSETVERIWRSAGGKSKMGTIALTNGLPRKRGGGRASKRRARTRPSSGRCGAPRARAARDRHRTRRARRAHPQVCPSASPPPPRAPRRCAAARWPSPLARPPPARRQARYRG